MPVWSVSRVHVTAIVAATLLSAGGCGPSRASQEHMARNLEQAQEPSIQPAQQDLLPPAGNDPRLEDRR